MTFITIKDFEKIGAWEIFASGDDGFFNNFHHWVAVKSRTGHMDWAVYYLPAINILLYPDKKSFEHRIAEWGDKLHDTELIQKLVNCDDEVLALYRQ